MSISKAGSLTVVGSGIKLVGQMTLDARFHIEKADKVFCVVTDALTERWISSLNPTTETLVTLYAEGKARQETYAEMVQTIMAAVRQGLRVCAVFYGHPAVFVNPSLEAVRLARQEGYLAYLLPGVSAEDCLFADLELDPAGRGCQSYEATDFLIRPRRFDSTVPLILWQIGVIGEISVKKEAINQHGLEVLADYLQTHYGVEHQVVVYEAAIFPVLAPMILAVPLANLAQSPVTLMSTLYVPPQATSAVDPVMLARLGWPGRQKKAS